jgi:hypothetical protein
MSALSKVLSRPGPDKRVRKLHAVRVATNTLLSSALAFKEAGKDKEANDNAELLVWTLRNEKILK